MIPQDLLNKVRRIELRTSRLVDSVLAGSYHSAFKGRGMEFEEVRQYQVGERRNYHRLSKRTKGRHIRCKSGDYDHYGRLP